MNCRAPGIQEEVSEITHEATETEELLCDEEESELDLDEVYDQLEIMKKRVIQLRAMLIKDRKPDRPMDRKCEEDLPTNGSKNDQLRELQRACAIMNQQVAQITKCLVHNSEELKEVDRRICIMQSETDKLAKQVTEYPKWQQDVQEHYGRCIERYQDVSITCSNLSDFCKEMLNAKNNYIDEAKRKVPLKCFKLDRQRVNMRLTSIRQHLIKADSLLQDNAEQMERELIQLTNLQVTEIYRKWKSFLEPTANTK